MMSLLWGFSFFFIEIALREIGPLTLVFYRIGIASLILVAFVYLSGQGMPFDAASWKKFFKLGMFNNLLPFSLISWGQIHIDSSLASILNATTPLFAVVMAHKLTHDEHMTRSRVIGVLLGIAGVSLLVGPEAIFGITTNVLGQIAILAAAVCYAYGGIYVRRLNDMPAIVVIAGTLTAATIMTLPLALLFEYPLRINLQVSTISALLGLSVFGTAAAYMLYIRVIRTVGATNTLLVTFLVPITALLLGVFVLGESLSHYAVLGMLVIFVGLLAVDGRLIHRLFHSDI